jgi:probable rRNA maturation factor
MPSKFYEEDTKAGLDNKRKLSAFIDRLIAECLPGRKTAQLSYVFCTDDFLLEMNKRYLAHDTLTDIITFDLSENSLALTGDIYISAERVRENAALFGAGYQDELHRVIFHGALHLCGFKDKKDADRKIMREKENECLEKYKMAKG